MAECFDPKKNVVVAVSLRWDCSVSQARERLEWNARLWPNIPFCVETLILVNSAQMRPEASRVSSHFLSEICISQNAFKGPRRTPRVHAYEYATYSTEVFLHDTSVAQQSLERMLLFREIVQDVSTIRVG